MSLEIVYVYLYDFGSDLSNQMLKATNLNVDYFYHTSIVCFAKEYYFHDTGIQIDNEVKSKYPARYKDRIALGKTKKTVEELENFIRDTLRMKYSNNHDFFNNNCNHFCNEVTQFLMSKNIPDKIGKYTDKLKNTPLEPIIRNQKIV